MTVIPAWPFLVDWTDGYTETLEWKTIILASPTGAEQRYSVRISPRRRLELPFVLAADERSYFDVLMMDNGGKPWYAPLAHDQVWCGSVVSSTLAFDTRFREYATGGHVILRGNKAWNWEVLTIASVTDDGITTVETPSITYPQGCMVFPAVLSKITNVIAASRHTGRAYTGSVLFAAIEPLPWPINGRTPVVPLLDVSGAVYPLLAFEPNAIEALDYSYERLLNTIDSGAALLSVTDTADRAFVSQSYAWLLHGAESGSNFRDLLFALGGMRGSLWVPTFNDDVAPDAENYPNPYLRFARTAPGRDLVLSFGRDGTNSAYHITAAGSATMPTGALDSGLVARVSFLNLKRFGQDAIEIVHQTNDVATVNAIMRDAPDLRTASTYYQIPYANALKNGVPAVNSDSDLRTDETVVEGS